MKKLKFTKLQELEAAKKELEELKKSQIGKMKNEKSKRKI